MTARVGITSTASARGFAPARSARARMAQALCLCALAAACCAVGACSTQSTETSKWDGTVDTSWYEPGRASYDLKSAAQLAGLAQLVDDGERFEGATVSLRVNVDLDRIEWNPIGGVASEGGGVFCGTFDGCGNTIANLRIVSQLENMALFATTGGGAIQNVAVRGGVMGRSGASGVVSEAVNTNFRNVVADIDVFSTNYYDNTDAAGLCGSLLYTDDGTAHEIVDCVNNGRVVANDWEVGGMIGQLACAEGVSVEVRNCENRGYVGVNAASTLSDQAVGGLVAVVGTLGSYRFVDCRNTADVYATEVAGVGGIVGFAGSPDTSFKNCQNSGAIATDSLNSVSAAAGIMAGYGVYGYTMEGCANTGSLSAFAGKTYDLAPGGTQ